MASLRTRRTTSRRPLRWSRRSARSRAGRSPPAWPGRTPRSPRSPRRHAVQTDADRELPARLIEAVEGLVGQWPKDADKAVAQSKRYGMKVAMLLIRTPAWARENTTYRLTPDREPSTIPPDRAQDYADFAVAVAKRYPSIHLWQIWGEPNRIGQFAITYYDSFKAKDGVYPLSPKQRDDVRRYAELIDAAYVSLKRHNRRNLIIGGMTAVGDITPLAWIRNLKLADGKPPRMDMYGHNPWGLRGRTCPSATTRPVPPKATRTSQTSTRSRGGSTGT